MQTFTIIENGDFDIPEIAGNVTWVSRRSDSTYVQIISNDESATVTMGFSITPGGDFNAFPNGEFTTGKLINHGHKCYLMVRVSGLTSATVVLALSEYK